MLDSEDSTVTYTAVSSPFQDGSDIGSPGVDGLPIMPEDPYAYIMAAYSDSPGYVPESDPEEEPEEDDEDPEEDPADYPADRSDEIMINVVGWKRRSLPEIMPMNRG
ncbi:hypothetical protein Tco_0635489 [Tanacetum coccineum]